MRRAIVLVGLVLLGGAPVAAQAAPPDGEAACRGLIALDRRLATLDRQFGELNRQDPPEILAPKQKDLLKLMQGDALALRKVLAQTGKPLGNEAADKYLPEFLAKNATFLGWFAKPDAELADEQRQQITDAVGEYRFEVGQSCDYYAPYNPSTDEDGQGGSPYPPGHNGAGDYGRDRA
ncbi:MAG: hypothetical protein ACRC20_11340 [Segniliparus sp.]|uniref:hypothetical protein n=1 Tax=Segniliparus sp. TaxID=2804064 RepID=UPI003F3290E7